MVQNTGKIVLQYQCSKCDAESLPWNNEEFVLPHTATITCPECKHVEKYTWYDEETKKMISRKKLGLLSSDEKNNQIIELTKKIELLQKELDLEKMKREMFDDRLAELEHWKKKRESMFNEIEDYYNEDREFKEQNK